MENTNNPLSFIPEVIKNSSFNIKIEGWSGTVSIISICASLVAMYGIKAHYSSALPLNSPSSTYDV